MSSELKLKCPKCESPEVLVGTQDEPNHCAKCEHEWEYEAPVAVKEHTKIFFKSPSVLFTINQNIRRRQRKNLFEDRLSHMLKKVCSQ